MAISVDTGRITYRSPSGDVQAYLARPTEGQPWPAVIVIHEVFGLVDHIEDVAGRFASEGYLALAPNLYSHDPIRPTLRKEDIELSLKVSRASDVEAALAELPAERQQGVRLALEWRSKRDISTQLPDLLAALDYLKSRPDVRGEAIGSVGYCMGGALSGRLATSGADIAAAVIYYGQIPPLEQVPNVQCPVIGHYGGLDTPITSRVPELEAAMQANGKDFTAYLYEGAPHAFFNDTRPSYTPDAARLSWERTLDFFQQSLKEAAIGAG